MDTRLRLGGADDSISDKILGEQDATDNPNYVRKSEPIVLEALNRGSDVMHFANGNIITTELKVLILQHNWSKERGKFERAKSAGIRNKRNRARAKNKNKRRINDQLISNLDNNNQDITNKEQLEENVS